MSRSNVEQARPAGAEAQQRLRERLAEIQAMPVSELQDLYYDLHGRATRARNRPWLIKRLSYKTQELVTGLTLSAEAEQRIADLGEDEPVRLRDPSDAPLPEPASKKRDPRLPPAGTIIRRAHQGEVHEVHVLADGFEYEGRHYTSLSTIAREVTGTSWNGFLWAGLVKRKKRKRASAGEAE